MQWRRFKYQLRKWTKLFRPWMEGKPQDEVDNRVQESTCGQITQYQWYFTK